MPSVHDELARSVIDTQLVITHFDHVFEKYVWLFLSLFIFFLFLQNLFLLQSISRSTYDVGN